MTNSELAKQRLLGALHYIGLPGLPVVVIHPPIADVQQMDRKFKKDLMVSIGPFRGDRSASHDMVVRGFAQFQADTPKRKWQLACIGEIENQDDLAYFYDLRNRAATSEVRFFISPTPQQKEYLFTHAKICISAAGSSSSKMEDCRLGPYSGIEIGRAISYGCVPLVPAGGVEAELCGTLGAGLVFHPDEIEEQLSFAASLACQDDVLSRLDSRMSFPIPCGVFPEMEARTRQEPHQS